MLRNPQLGGKTLHPFCRSMGRMLEAGVEVRKALKSSSRNAADGRLTTAVENVSKHVRKGDTMASAFAMQEGRFPPLFLDLVNVGEETGSLPEVFFSLADYYEANVNRMRQFRSQIAWPLFQLFAAILIIGLLIYILGIVQSTAGGQPQDILGLGLVGTSGAIKWFLMTFGTIGISVIGFIVLTRSTSGKEALHPFLMTVPGLGYVMRSFGIARFSWCFALTQKAGMGIRPSLESSLRATANGAFIAATPHIWNDIHEGESFTDALTRSRLFPAEFLQIVDTAETSGTIPESLDRMSQRFDEDAHRALTWITAIIARVVWFLVACFIGYIVISFFMRYIGMINELTGP
ncbi:MAG: type II secretion system F family protein [Planctomycetaceae bacterium]|nr:type II secretion system F family protein [Planctomycetaceae bacterium]